MSGLFGFLKHYRLFSVATLSLVISLVLQIDHQATAAHWLLSVVAVIAVLPLVWDMWQDVRAGRYGIDILAATAIIVSVILGQYWAAMVVVLMLSGGQALEDYAERRARSELSSLLAQAPKTAQVLRKGQTVETAVDDIKVGDRIVIKAGELVPVDAIVTEGQANFDEASLTGESLPQAKKEGGLLLSGSINLDGVVTAKATANAADSQYQRIIKLVKSAAASEAPFVRLADRYSLPFTVAAFALAITVWVISGQAIRFLEVIIVATPCPLLLAAPIALISGMARASRYGIIVKTGQALERLAEARSIAFDKTGTLTRGELSVHSIKTFGKYKKDEVLKLAASLEQNSNHVLARAIVTDARVKNLKLLKAKHLEEVPGLGVKANLRGAQVIVGNRTLMKQAEVKLPVGASSKLNETAAYIAVDGSLAGVITFIDEVRPETKLTLEYLHVLGLTNVAMVTGDHQAAAQAIAKKLAIDAVYADALPADKLHVLSKLKPRPVIFVGDGVNDAPVLTAADVGIALGARGSTAASESADMVVMLDDISRVATGLEIAKKTFAIARQSILIGIGLSLALMVIFASGAFPPLAGAIVQEVVDVFVIFNALRAHIISPLMVEQQQGGH